VILILIAARPEEATRVLRCTFDNGDVTDLGQLHQELTCQKLAEVFKPTVDCIVIHSHADATSRTLTFMGTDLNISVGMDTSIL